MQYTSRIKDHYSEQKLFVQRSFIAALLITCGIVALIARLVWLQVIRYDYFAEQSTGNRIRFEPLPPSRGLILDRNGVPLALNTPSYQLELTREQVSDLDDTLQRLANLQLLDRDDLPTLKRDILSRRSFEAVPVKLSLNDEELARFAARRQDFPGVEIKPRLTRRYPLAASGVHAIGYVGIISEADQKVLDPDEYAGTALVGKAGVEKRYEQMLHGKAGYQQLLVNAQGRRVDQNTTRAWDLQRKDPIAGEDLFLTIDERLQSAVEDMLQEKRTDASGNTYEDERRAAVIAIDPNNGDVLAFVSTPGFDPNLFGRGLSSAQYRALVNDPDKPMYDRVIRGTYPSGSTIKPFMAMAGLYYNVIAPSTTNYCPGYFRLPGVARPWTDLHAHGAVDMVQAIKVSCDVYFYNLANLMGIDRIHDYLSQFGFGQLTGIDIDGEMPAVLPSTAWKRDYFKRKEAQQWYAGDTISVGIGQGYLTVTPLQLAHAAATLSMHGKGFEPHLIHAIRNPVTGNIDEVPPVPIEPVKVRDNSNWDVVIQGMQEVVKPGGTASVAFVGVPYTVAAKTGTAQVHGLAVGEKYNAAQLAERLRDNALFIAFAPVDHPRVAVAVVVENAGHGGTAAAPIARRIFDLMLLTPEQLAAQEAKQVSHMNMQAKPVAAAHASSSSTSSHTAASAPAANSASSSSASTSSPED